MVTTSTTINVNVRKRIRNVLCAIVPVSMNFARSSCFQHSLAFRTAVPVHRSISRNAHHRRYNGHGHGYVNDYAHVFWSSVSSVDRHLSVRWATTTTTDGDSDSNESDEFASYTNKNNMNDQVVSVLSACGGIKVTCATLRNLVNDLMIQHTLSEVTADALGRTVACGLLLSNGMAPEHVVQITVNGDGPIRGIVGICRGDGKCKGYVGTPGLSSSIALEDAVGKGTVQVVKNHPDWPNPYNGITQIRDGDIDADVGLYLAESEQRSCALAAAITCSGILCTSAGGYLVEKLPGCDNDVMRRVEQNLKALSSSSDDGEATSTNADKLPTHLLLRGETPIDIAGRILDGLGMQPLQQIAPVLECGCSDNRLLRSLRLLPKEEIDQIIEMEEKVEARCQFCGKVYSWGATEVRERLAQATGDPSRDEPN